MARNVRVELDRAAVRAVILKGEGTAGLLNGLAEGIARRAGSGYETDAYDGRNRRNASVYPATKEAAQANLRGNTLLKAIRG